MRLLFKLLLCAMVFGIGTAQADEPATKEAPDQPPSRLLVVTVTKGFRHGSIQIAEPVLEELGRTSGLFHVDFLKSGDNEQFAKAFELESLANFDGVIFASTTGNLPIPDLPGFMEWIRGGKAFIGIHAATDTLGGSDAYCEMVGGSFAGHPWGGGDESGFVVQEPTHRLTAMFPQRFRWKDEIYQYDKRFQPENLRVLISLDMSASNKREPWHVPVSWIRDYGKGRVFYTNLGHNDATWKDVVFQKHLTEGIAWALGRFDAPSKANPDTQAAEYLRSVLAVAANALGKNPDNYRVKADAKIAADPTWATGLRPMLLEIREMKPPARAETYTKLIDEIEKP